MSFYQRCCNRKRAAKIKRLEYPSLGKQLKAQTSITKDQYKLLNDQRNKVIDINRKDADSRRR